MREHWHKPEQTLSDYIAKRTVEEVAVSGLPQPNHPVHAELAQKYGGIGDLASDAKGSGARFNTGKIPVELLPIRVLLGSVGQSCAAVLLPLAHFQARRGVDAANLGQAWDAARKMGDLEVHTARVFEYGRKKYAAFNWAKGMPWTVPLACGVRHTLALAGVPGFLAPGNTLEVNDPESGLPHLGHLGCNLVMLMTYLNTYPEGDDRPAAGLLASVEKLVV